MCNWVEKVDFEQRRGNIVLICHHAKREGRGNEGYWRGIQGIVVKLAGRRHGRRGQSVFTDFVGLHGVMRTVETPVDKFKFKRVRRKTVEMGGRVKT